MKSFARVTLKRTSEFIVYVGFDTVDLNPSNNDDMKKVWEHAKKLVERDVESSEPEYSPTEDSFDVEECKSINKVVDEAIEWMPKPDDWRVRRFRDIVMRYYVDPLKGNREVEASTVYGNDDDAIRRVIKVYDGAGLMLTSATVDGPRFVLDEWIDEDGEAKVDDHAEDHAPKTYFDNLHAQLVMLFKVPWGAEKTYELFMEAFEWDLRGKLREGVKERRR